MKYLLFLAFALFSCNKPSQKQVEKEPSLSQKRFTPEFNKIVLKQTHPELLKDTDMLGVSQAVSEGKKQAEMEVKKTQESKKPEPKQDIKKEISEIDTKTDIILTDLRPDNFKEGKQDIITLPEKPNKKPLILTSPTTSKTKQELIKPTPEPVLERDYFIQAGSYFKKSQAQSLAHKINTKTKQKFYIETVKIKNRPYYRVKLGPVKTEAQASKILQKVVKAGYYDAYIVKPKNE
jgi:cell division protein FtsN